MTRPPAISLATVERAQQGVLAAIDQIIVALQPGLYNLSVRMLGNREDAAEACQEILLKIVTHLGGFRGESSFSAWAWQIARNHLLHATTRTREAPTVSFDAIAERLEAGLAFDAAQGERSLTPEDKAAAKEIAVGCTQGMLMALDRDHRLAWLLDVVFGLASEDAAQVLDIAPAAYRQRLSRARRRLDGFMDGQCALANASAACGCERQIRPVRAIGGKPLLGPRERAEVDRNFQLLVQMGDAASVFRAHPDYAAPDAMIAAIRGVLRQEGFLDRP